MKLTINTEILKKYSLTLEEYLVLLTGYYGKDYSRGCDSLLNKGLISPNLFYQTAIVLSDNTTFDACKTAADVEAILKTL